MAASAGRSVPVRSREVILKALHCGDLMSGCDFVARGATEDEVMQKAAEHAKTAHGMQDIPPDMAPKVRAAIRDEQSA